MRLRQVALASRNLDSVVRALGGVFGLQVAYNDPHIQAFGLRNAVLPVGNAFIEVVEPVSADASASRFLDRRGGDAGYMVILQVAGAEAERARIQALGVRVVADIDNADYRAAHFHPADFGGVLVSVDQQRTEPDPAERDGDWWPAGPAWRQVPCGQVSAMLSVSLSSPDPRALAARWSALLGRPLDAADPFGLTLDDGAIRFCRQADAEATSITGVDLSMSDASGARARARATGLDVTEAGILIGGVRFRPTSGK